MYATRPLFQFRYPSETPSNGPSREPSVELSEFRDLIDRYLRAFPDSPEGLEADWNRFTRWALSSAPMPLRKVFLGWFTALTKVEQHGARLQLAIQRFESIAGNSGELTGPASGQQGWTVHLNPTYVMASRDLHDAPSQGIQRVDVIVFACRGEVRSVVLRKLESAIIQSIAYGPAHLAVIQDAVSGLATADETFQTIRRLVDQRILAISAR